jgi:hypothetical protein
VSLRTLEQLALYRNSNATAREEKGGTVYKRSRKTLWVRVRVRTVGKDRRGTLRVIVRLGTVCKGGTGTL